MKILFLNYEYPPLGGGAAIATEALLKEFLKVPDLEVHLVTSAVGDTFIEEKLSEKVFIYRLPIGKDPTKLHAQSLKDIFLYTWRTFFFLRNFIPKQKIPFDRTLAFFTLPCGFLAYLIKCRWHIPYTVSLRGADVPGFSEKYNTFYFFLKPLVRFLWKEAEAVVPNSPGLRLLAQKTSPKQAMQIIENGIDTEMFFPQIEKRTPHPIVFLSLSRLTQRKGIDRLLRAFAQVVGETEKPVALWLVGDGEEKKNLEALARELKIQELVRFFGRVEHSLAPPYYQKAHVFVLPSKNEGMSNALLEALSSGLPLVVSRTGGMKELVTDGENGFFIEPNNEKDFAEKLLLFVRDEKLILSLGEASRTKALTRSWKKVAEDFLRALKQ